MYISKSVIQLNSIKKTCYFSIVFKYERHLAGMKIMTPLSTAC